MKVLSLFDGISCGQVALERAGISVEKYYAAEIDKYAITITQANYPDTVQLGDMTKWREWDIDWGSIDLLTAGFPCQAWSVAGKQEGDDDPRGALVHDLIDIWKHIRELNPKLKFLFENVKMKKEFLEYINDLFGVEPILINSALVSAQNRNRYYWTNIEGVVQPDDAGVLLSHVFEPHLKSCGVGGAVRGRRLNALGKREDYNFNIPITQYLEVRQDEKSNCLSTVEKDNVVSYLKTDKRMLVKRNQSKSSCLTGGAHSGGNHSDMDILVIDPDICRRYSTVECERLQTLPDNYTNHVSDTQRYKAIGNGWTVDVIAHIYSYL